MPLFRLMLQTGSIICYTEHKHTFIQSVKIIRMGNFSNPLLKSSSIAQLTQNSKVLSEQTKDKFIIRQMMTQSSKQYHEFLIDLSKIKQYQCEHIVRLVDSHTMQSNNLCSLNIYIYAILQKPKYTFEAYLQQLNTRKEMLCNKKIVKIITGVVKALSFLKQQGNDVQKIKEQNIFIDEDENGQIVTKIMNPYFKQCFYQSEQIRDPIIDLASILKKYLRFQLHSQDLIQTILKMLKGKATLEQLEQKFVNDGKKAKIRLKITKNATNAKYDRTSKAERQSFTSFASDGSSLMIEGGDTSDFALKEFYQNLDDQISNIDLKSMDRMLTSYTMDECNISHQFPKRYLNNKAFKKTPRYLGSDLSEEKVNITRDQSLKQNVRLQCRHIVLSSAKMVESFIDDI